MDQSKQPGIEFQQIFTEYAQFAHREDSLQLPPVPPPGDLEVEFAMNFQVSEDGQSGLLRLGVKTVPESHGHYRFDVGIAALIAVRKAEANLTIPEYAQAAAVATLYPFARELVANLTSRGRFGPVWLNPVNFLALQAQEPAGKKRESAKPTMVKRPVRPARRRN